MVGGYPIPGLAGGVPHLRSEGGPEMGYPPNLGWGTPPDLGWGTPQTWDEVPPLTWDRVPPRHGTGYPPTWDGVPPPRQISIASCCYTAGGMPLAFTQEDFLVHNVSAHSKQKRFF